jgi:hypothetical protein
MEKEMLMQAQPQKEHAWLQKLVGEWTFEAESLMGPGQPAGRSQGSERVRSLGGLWVLAEGCGEMPGGGSGTTLIALGYDPARKRFVGTFLGSMMTHLWVYDGELDPTGKVLTLDTEGPSFTDEGKMVKYKDVIEIRSDDHRVLSSLALGDDGTWHRFMTANYRRTK